jgi:glycosyltransferase involved in cell wall biosynthesis
MKVLQALFFPPEQPGGVSSMIPYIMDRFVKLDWQMELFYLPKRVRDKGREDISFASFSTDDYAGIPVVDKYLQTIRDYIWWVRMRIKDEYDLIHAHHPIPALVFRKLFPNTPVLITIHSSFERELKLNGQIVESGPEERFLTALYRELELSVDAILTVSESFRKYLASHLEHGERIIVIPNGFDESRFRPILHENKVTQLITVCRLVEAKGLDVLLQALAGLKKDGRSFVLHLIGDGPMRADLEKMARELDIYEETIFYGYMLHPEEFMPFSDIFVLPSRAEAFGNVFAEAALCKLALVGTNIGGIAEQIDDGVSGYLVPLDDVSALHHALRSLLDDPQLCTTMAENAWQKAHREYSLDRVMEQLIHQYRHFSHGCD